MQKIPSKDELKRLRRRKREMMGPDAPESSDDEQAHNDYCNAAINADAHNLHLKNDSFGRNDNKNISQNDVKSAESLRLDVLPVSPPTTDSFKENQQLTPVTMKNFGQPPLSSQIVRRSFLPTQTVRAIMQLHFSQYPQSSFLLPYLMSSPSTSSPGQGKGKDNSSGEDLSQIHMAAGTGNIKLLNACFKVFDINCPDLEGRTPLIYAVIGNDPKIIEILNKRGCDLDRTDFDGRTAIHWAAYYGRFLILKQLIRYGGDWTIHDNEGRTALHWSTGNDSVLCLEALLQYATAFEINEPDGEQMSLVHWVFESFLSIVYSFVFLILKAVYHNHPKHLKRLLRKKPNILQSDVEGKTALHWCSPHKDVQCATLLLTFDPRVAKVSDLDGRTPLHLACSENNMALVSLLSKCELCDINAQDATLRSALHWATVSGHHSLVTLLLDSNASDSVCDGLGATPLHYACSKNHAQCIHALLSRPSSSYLADNEGRHALIWAVTKGHVQSVRILLEKKIDCNLSDNHGSTALHAAAYSGQTHCVSLLLEHDARVDVADDHAHTPLFRAVEKGYAEAANLLIQAKSEINRVDREGRTPLHWSALFGHLPVLSLLLANGAQVDQKDNYGKTALHCGAYNGHNEVVKYLIECGADINAVDKEELTPLHWCAIMGNPHTLELLLQQGAIRNPTDGMCLSPTPMDFAVAEKNDVCVNILLQFGGKTGIQLRSEAARIIQKIWRGYQARRLMTSGVKREMFAWKRLKEKAAMIIQHRYRKHLESKRVPIENAPQITTSSAETSGTVQPPKDDVVKVDPTIYAMQNYAKRKYETQLELIAKHQSELEALRKMTEQKIQELGKAMQDLDAIEPAVVFKCLSQSTSPPNSAILKLDEIQSPGPSRNMAVQAIEEVAEWEDEPALVDNEVLFVPIGRKDLNATFNLTMSTAEREYFRIEQELRENERKH